MKENLTFWKNLYQTFDGILPGCKGYRCDTACCRQVDVLIFPEERLFLESVYGETIASRMKWVEDGFSILNDCSDGKNCLFFKYRPLICRTYPCMAVFEDQTSLVFKIDRQYCPATSNIAPYYVHYSYKLWQKVAIQYDYYIKKEELAPLWVNSSLLCLSQYSKEKKYYPA